MGGTISDAENNPLPGASVVIKGTTTGATTDFDGAFNINATQGDVLVISFVGFETQEVTYDGSELAISMQEGLSLDEVLVTGNRNKPRTAIDSAVPIDNIRTSDIQNVGEKRLSKEHLHLPFHLLTHKIKRSLMQLLVLHLQILVD